MLEYHAWSTIKIKGNTTEVLRSKRSFEERRSNVMFDACNFVRIQVVIRMMMIDSFVSSNEIFVLLVPGLLYGPLNKILQQNQRKTNKLTVYCRWIDKRLVQFEIDNHSAPAAHLIR